MTAVLTAAFYGHLTVLRTLVEQYGGNLLHRDKVKCCMMRETVSLLYVGKSLIIPSIENIEQQTCQWYRG